MILGIGVKNRDTKRRIARSTESYKRLNIGVLNKVRHLILLKGSHNFH